MAWIDEMLSGIPVNAVLRERMLLVSEQRGAAQAEAVALRAENEALKFENSQLKEQLRRLGSDIVQKHGQHLEEVRERLLVALSAGEGLQANQLAQAVGIGEQLATFHLNEMKKTRLVSAAMFYTGRPTIWSIGQEGRSYLVTHGLLT